MRKVIAATQQQQAAPLSAQIAWLQATVAAAGGMLPSTIGLKQYDGYSLGDLFRAKFPGADYSKAIKAGVESSALRSGRSRGSRPIPLLFDGRVAFVPTAKAAKPAPDLAKYRL